MHPVNYLFEEINREHWGIPQSNREAHLRREEPARYRFHPLLRAKRGS